MRSPGIRTGVARGSAFRRTEYFGPVLGILHAASLDVAVAWQNAVDYGLTAGMHTQNAGELASWLGPLLEARTTERPPS